MFSLLTLLLYFGLLLALPVAYIFVSWKVGAAVSRKTGARAAGLVLTSLLLLLPSAWVTAAVVQFRRACSPPVQAAIPSWVERQESFVITGDRPSKLAMQKFYHFSIDELAANGIRFYEDLYMVRNQPDVRRVFVGRSEHAKSVESQYAFVTTITSSWLPVYNVTHRVERRSDGQTVAIAKETVLGGGLIGKYMRGFGGGQDAEFISCGYTGGQVGHWRPNDTSNPRYREYQATDNAFVLRALGRR